MVFFSGSNAGLIKSSRNLWLRMVDFHVKSGRAVIYPVYKGTYGRFDFGSPFETRQKPFFDLLGTPAQNKRHVVLDAGHLPPQYIEIVKEMLAWADSRLGPVAR